MINNKFDEKLLGKIKEQKIKPKPRWHFLLKNYVIWSIGIVSAIIGSLAFSVIIYLFKYNDWNIYNKVSSSFWGFVMLTLPYFWIIFLVLFTFLVYYNIKHTKSGYRYSLWLILSVNIVASIVLGSIFFKMGISQTLDNILGERMPFYSKFINPQIHFWSKPDDGRLTGIIISEKDSEIILLDLNQNEWQVDIKKADIISEEEIDIGKPIRIMGKKISDNFFIANGIIPVQPPGQGFFQHHKNELFNNINHMGSDMMFMEKEFDIFKKYPEFKEKLKMDFLEFDNNKDSSLIYSYVINANCLIEINCDDKGCEIICDEYNDNQEDCEKKEDCNCDDEKRCVCLDKKCFLLKKNEEKK